MSFITGRRCVNYNFSHVIQSFHIQVFSCNLCCFVSLGDGGGGDGRDKTGTVTVIHILTQIRASFPMSLFQWFGGKMNAIY